MLGAAAMAAFAAEFGMQRTLVLLDEGFTGQRIGCRSMTLEAFRVTDFLYICRAASFLRTGAASTHECCH
jgi:hypothetical protein